MRNYDDYADQRAEAAADRAYDAEYERGYEAGALDAKTGRGRISRTDQLDYSRGWRQGYADGYQESR